MGHPRGVGAAGHERNGAGCNARHAGFRFANRELVIVAGGVDKAASDGLQLKEFCCQIGGEGEHIGAIALASACHGEVTQNNEKLVIR